MSCPAGATVPASYDPLQRQLLTACACVCLCGGCLGSAGIYGDKAITKMEDYECTRFVAFRANISNYAGIFEEWCFFCQLLLSLRSMLAGWLRGKMFWGGGVTALLAASAILLCCCVILFYYVSKLNKMCNGKKNIAK